MKRFAIVTRGRTGSSAVADELNNHPSVVCLGEAARPDPLVDDVLRDLYDRYGDNFFRTDRHTEYGGRDRTLPLHLHAKSVGRSATPKELRRWLRHVELEFSDSKAVGFKLLTNHARRIQGGFAALANTRCDVIWLRRRNIVRQVISALVATETGLHNSDTGPAEARSFEFSPEEIVRRTLKNEQQEPALKAELKESGVRLLELFYEDYLGDRAFFHDTINSFLGVERMTPAPTTFAIMTPEPLTELLRNFGAISSALDSAGLRHYLE